jgi:serine/threonine protein phosphatase PrpC
VAEKALQAVGTASLIGRRTSQEDFCFTIQREDGVRIIGVFDGHGGSAFAQYAAGHLETVFGSLPISEIGEQTIKRLFAELHQFHTEPESGTTAILVVQIDKRLICAWVGDSRCLLVKQNGILQLTTDHRLSNETEKKRIVETSYFGHEYTQPVVSNSQYRYVWSLKGDRLMVTRALGDQSFNEVGVSAEPEIVFYDLEDGDVLCLAVTDGVWGAVDDQEIIKLTSQSSSAGNIAECLVKAALQNGSKDNVTAAVCMF